MHINVSGEQHTHSIKQLLKNINTNPESVNELGGWGLEVGTEILMVGILSLQKTPSFKAVMQSARGLFSPQELSEKCTVKPVPCYSLSVCRYKILTDLRPCLISLVSKHNAYKNSSFRSGCKSLSFLFSFLVCPFSLWTFLFLYFSQYSMNIFLFCRSKVELFPLKPSACSLHPLPLVLMCLGPERL